MNSGKAIWTRLCGDIRPGDSAGAILDRNLGAGPGFEMLRIVLAASVLAAHLQWLTGTQELDRVMATHAVAAAHHLQPLFFYPQMYVAGAWRHLLRTSLVPLFFALSGFLVTGSALRLRHVPTFLAFRALRIVPALCVEITLSALLLGPILTTFPLGRYFSDPLLYSYFGNIIGDIHYYLPGLYAHNPSNQVNRNLWTLPGEFLCYAALASLMAARVVYNRMALTLAFVAATIGLTGMVLLQAGTEDSLSPNALAMFFLAGIVLYQWREHCPIRFDLLILAVLIALLGISSPRLLYLAPLPMAYCAVFLGMVRFPSPRLISSGDYSYGIYLYGAPLTQALICIFPGFREHPGLLLLPAMALSYAFAVASWHQVEKPALKLKTHLPERWFPRARKVIPPSIGIVDIPSQAEPAPAPGDRHELSPLRLRPGIAAEEQA